MTQISESASKLLGLIETVKDVQVLNSKRQLVHQPLTAFTYDDYMPAFYGQYDDTFTGIESEEEFNTLVTRLNNLLED
jgi:hypothetical protein